MAYAVRMLFSPHIKLEPSGPCLARMETVIHAYAICVTAAHQPKAGAISL